MLPLQSCALRRLTRIIHSNDIRCASSAALSITEAAREHSAAPGPPHAYDATPAPATQAPSPAPISPSLSDAGAVTVVHMAGRLASSTTDESSTQLSAHEIIDRWKALSARAVALIDRGAPLHELTFLLLHLAEADLSPTQRRALAFPSRFKEALLKGENDTDSLSEDELAIAADCLQQLRLTDKSTALFFYRRFGATLRFRQLSVRNLVRLSHGMRQFRFLYPVKRQFVEKLMRVLLKRRGELQESQLLVDGLLAVGRMTKVNPATCGKIQELLASHVPRMVIEELALVPSVTAALDLTDEEFFTTYTNHLVQSLPILSSRELLLVFRGLLHSRVGPAGTRRAGLPAFLQDVLSPRLSRLSGAVLVRLAVVCSRLAWSHPGQRQLCRSDQAIREGLSVFVSRLFERMGAILNVISGRQLVMVANAAAHLDEYWTRDAAKRRHFLEALYREIACQLRLVVLPNRQMEPTAAEGGGVMTVYTSHDLAVLLRAFSFSMHALIGSPDEGQKALTACQDFLTGLFKKVWEFRRTSVESFHEEDLDVLVASASRIVRCAAAAVEADDSLLGDPASNLAKGSTLEQPCVEPAVDFLMQLEAEREIPRQCAPDALLAMVTLLCVRPSHLSRLSPTVASLMHTSMQQEARPDEEGEEDSPQELSNDVSSLVPLRVCLVAHTIMDRAELPERPPSPPSERNARRPPVDGKAIVDAILDRRRVLRPADFAFWGQGRFVSVLRGGTAVEELMERLWAHKDDLQDDVTREALMDLMLALSKDDAEGAQELP
ncbi:unnamed protein product [Vitrella brassicaformis CCMP3155]|uniref:RAP domain-containing protein n=2 Tax=Vitrella brassicaformis TaxID=1169539 RepID=A0A0G4EZJ1_VITBC|nr:unnamed protein product [Vitrella brassicaformis CCMP3155]|eukprot:CEM04225.1 unnamed protein product [Vitrella brassicaformis CCMP3155]